MLVSSFNLLQSFNYAPSLFCKKRFKSEINCFCIRTLVGGGGGGACGVAVFIVIIFYNIVQIFNFWRQ